MKTLFLLSTIALLPFGSANALAGGEPHKAAERAEQAARSALRSADDRRELALRIIHINDDGIHPPIVSEVASFKASDRETPIEVKAVDGRSHVILNLKLTRKKSDQLDISGTFKVAVFHEGRVVPGLAVPIGQGSSFGTVFKSEHLVRGVPFLLSSTTELNSPGKPKFEDTSSLFLIWD